MSAPPIPVTDSHSEAREGAAVARRFSFDPLDSTVFEDPYPYYRLLRDEHPAYFVESRGLWVISRYQDVMAASTDKSWSCAPVGERTRTPDRELTGWIKHALTGVGAARLEAKVRDHVSSLALELRESDDVDFVEQFSVALTARVIGSLLGMPVTDHGRCRVWADALVRRLEDVDCAEDDPVVAAVESEADREALLDFADYMTVVARERRMSPREDLVSTLVRVESPATRLTDTDIIEITAAFLEAAFPWSSHQISNTLVALAAHPDQRKLVREHRSKVPAMVEESLRWDPAMQGCAVTARRDVVIDGTVIRRGSEAILLWASAYRDERHYDDPDRFDVERTVDSQSRLRSGAVPYGVGPALARLELRVAFAELLEALGDYEVDLDGAERLHSPSFRGFSYLPITVHGRRDAA